MSFHFHVDMDAFFAAVEARDDPSIAGKPVIVGARPGTRGVVSTCSYEARAFGVRSAMPISEAVRRCPDGVFLRPRMERYCEESRKIESVLGSFTPDVRMVSIDEAFLDMTGTERLWGPPMEAAARIKARVREETGLAMTVGGASNRYVAKIASSVFKPDGLTIVEPGREADFMRTIPIDKLWGAGEATRNRFRELGIATVARLAELPERYLRDALGEAAGAFFHKAARGVDPGAFEARNGSRSMSAERTFERDVADRETLRATLLDMAFQLSFRLRSEGKRSRTVCLKLRTSDFSTTTTRDTSESPLDTVDELRAAAESVLDRAWDGTSPVRLLGVGLDGLFDASDPVQGTLFDAPRERKRDVESAVFEIGKKGIGTVTRASLLAREDGNEDRPRARRGPTSRKRP